MITLGDWLTLGPLALLGALGLWGWRHLAGRRAPGAPPPVAGYQLLARIARGGMGEVWQARHQRSGREVAIKMPRADATLDAAAHARRAHHFRAEQDALARLRSAHVVRLLDRGQTRDGRPYAVLELLPGLDLSRLVKRHGPQPAARVARWLAQAALALAEAHERGLVHGDVKPGNLQVGRRGGDPDHLTLLDFGLVRASPATRDPRLRPLSESTTPTLEEREQDSIEGTFAFLAPEIAAGHPRIGPAADIYGLGCVAYWLLTGQYVFSAGSPVEMAIAHLREVPEPPSRRTPGRVPAALEDLILACLDKDPARRPGARELRRRIKTLRLCDWQRADAEAWWRDHGDGAARVSASFAEAVAAVR